MRRATGQCDRHANEPQSEAQDAMRQLVKRNNRRRGKHGTHRSTCAGAMCFGKARRCIHACERDVCVPPSLSPSTKPATTLQRTECGIDAAQRCCLVLCYVVSCMRQDSLCRCRRRAPTRATGFRNNASRLADRAKAKAKAFDVRLCAGVCGVLFSDSSGERSISRQTSSDGWMRCVRHAVSCALSAEREFHSLQWAGRTRNMRRTRMQPTDCTYVRDDRNVATGQRRAGSFRRSRSSECRSRSVGPSRPPKPRM